MFSSARKSKHTNSSEIPTIPWVEKYRPKTVDDVVHQEEVTSALRNALETSNLPHLLFYGPPGTGKTSTILAIARQLFGPELFKSRVLELNASDERGIDVIRTKVKTFAQISVGQKPSNYDYPCPPFKLIILDEADAMTVDAQAALRRTMELYSKVTRFCIICNYVSRIIEPITSRCAKFRFKQLEGSTIVNKLMSISQNEQLILSSDAAQSIVAVSGGDMRRAITTLQSASRMYGGSLTQENITQIANVVPSERITRLYEACTSNSFEQVQSVVTGLEQDGFAASQILTQFHELIMARDDISDVNRSLLSMQLAETDKNLFDGADEFLQLLNVASFVMRTAC